ncbi:SET domain-containing protein 4-like [Calliopsis andreniformis]|uniref:SET domain-containing protein 4-like n=1 Tax=Calliopsis andreniformis TaxID=337506 RepID=UPI003FCE37C0
MGRTSRKRRQKKKLCVKEIAENEEENLMRLKSWLLTNNCLSIRNLVPSNFSITGRGLKTLQNIKPNDTIIQIPYTMLITSSTISQSNIKVIFSKNEYYNAQCILSVFLIYESHLGSMSKWYHYINTLPRTLTNPDFCTQKEKNLLPTFILDFMYEFHKIQKDYQFIIRSMNALNLNVKCPHCNVHFNKIITFERYKWAYYIVNTRSVYIDTYHIEKNRGIFINVKHPNNIALAPFLDLFNHDIHATIHASVVTDKSGNKFYEITTLNSFNAGSQVFINYGAHNSLKLYVHYGFFIQNNPLDEIYFDINDIQTCFNIPKFKLDFIVDNNLQKDMAFTREGLNYNAKATLFILNTNLQKEQWCTKIYGDSLSMEDIFNTYNAAKKILNLKKSEMTNYLRNMKSLEHYTQCYLIAINLVEEIYIIKKTVIICNTHIKKCLYYSLTELCYAINKEYSFLYELLM